MEKYKLEQEIKRKEYDLKLEEERKAREERFNQLRRDEEAQRIDYEKKR